MADLLIKAANNAESAQKLRFLFAYKNHFDIKCQSLKEVLIMKIDETALIAMVALDSAKRIDVVGHEDGYSVCVTGKDGKAHFLSSQRSKRRTWKSLDTLHGFLRGIGVGSYSVI